MFTTHICSIVLASRGGRAEGDERELAAGARQVGLNMGLQAHALEPAGCWERLIMTRSKRPTLSHVYAVLCVLAA